MKKTIVFLLICFLFPGFIKQLKGQDISSQQKSMIEKEVDSVFYVMIKAAENLEFDILNQGVDDIHKAGFILNGSYFMQFDSLLNNVETRSQGIAKQTISVKGQKITVLSQTIVLLTAYGDAKVDINSGDSFTTKFFWSFVYEKINNNWKVVGCTISSIRL